MSKKKFLNYLLEIAKVCHEANRQWCNANGDDSQKMWDDAEHWQQESAIKGVLFRIDNPTAGPDSQHNSWMKDKIEKGWVNGKVKNETQKTHPCIVPFDNLPEFQKKKDKLFVAIVDALK